MSEVVWRLKKQVTLQEEGRLVLDLETGRVVELNDSAWIMVRLLGHKEEEIVRAVLHQYSGLEHGEIVLDFRHLVVRLKELDLIEGGGSCDMV